jgi:hypothetical protein
METREELQAKLIEAKTHVQIGSYYRHYKGGEYKVLDLAFEEVTMQVVVIYQPQYGEHRFSFTRPLTAWGEFVEWEGESLPRFALIEK